MDSALYRIYDKLWADAVGHILHDGVQTDPHLLNREGDHRRGLTLIARPNQAVQDGVCHFLHEMAQVVPAQHFYAADALHLTVLSLITTSAQFSLIPEELTLYRQVMHETLHTASPILLRFHGITASPSGVLVQGFPEADALNQLRDQLRVAVRSVGLGHSLDARYRLVAAHMTVLRFAFPVQDATAFVERLQRYRHHDFGEAQIDTLYLVTNDWYMSPDRVTVLGSYPLSGENC